MRALTGPITPVKGRNSFESNRLDSNRIESWCRDLCLAHEACIQHDDIGYNGPGGRHVANITFQPFTIALLQLEGRGQQIGPEKGYGCNKLTLRHS